MMQEFTLTLLQCKLLTTDTEKLCYTDARTGVLAGCKKSSIKKKFSMEDEE